MRNKDFILPQDIYSEHLEKINGVKFTPREIDVIACISCGRTSKKTASFLSISSKTVDNHKHNIMVKLGCNARDGIIDFIEKSSKMLSLRRYYSSLAAQTAFEKQLKEISVLVGKEPPLAFIICQQKEGETVSLLNHFNSHLKLAGIKAVITTTKDAAFFNDVITNTESQRLNYIITMMPDEFIKTFRSVSEEIFKGLVDLTQEDSQTPLSIVFLSLEKERMRNTLKKSSDSGDVFFLDKQNYYFSVLDLLEKLLPTLNVDKIISDFKQQQERLSEDSEEIPEQVDVAKRELSQKGTTRKGIDFSILKFNLSGSLLFSIGVLCVLFLLFKIPNREHQGDPSIRSDLIIPADSSLLNRSALLTQIHDKLHRQNKTGINTVALVGVGGAGKSILARQYARNQKNSVVWEVNAETKESLITSFETLAYALSKTEEEKKELRTLLESKNTLEKEAQFFVFLKKQLRSYPNWLLIYDNIDTFNSIRDYFPHDATVWGNGQVIITTQDANIKNTTYINNAHIVNVEGLSNEESMSLFTKIMNLETTQQPFSSEENLLREIPPFPLDISTAAYFLKETKIPYEQYVERMTTQSASFATTQENTLQDVGKYNKTRYGIITLSLKNIIDQNKDFQNLLWLIELIGSENIPKELLDFYKGDDLVHTFIHALKKSSLILETSLSSLEAPITFSMHRSIHKIISSYLMRSLSLEKQTPLMREAVQVIEKYLIYILDKEDVEKIKIFSSHLEQFLSHEALLKPAETATLKGGLGSLYYYQGFYDKAKETLGNSQKAVAQFLSPHSLQLANVAGVVYKLMGDYAKATDVLEKDLLFYKKYYPEDHDNMAWTLTCLGHVYKKLGRYEDAKTTLEKSVLIYKKNYKNHPDMVWPLLSLVNVYRKLGELEKARLVLNDVSKINATHLDRRGADTGLLSLSIYLGTAYRHLGDYDKAKEVLAEALKKHVEIFGWDNIQTASASSHLAKIYRDSGNYEKADYLFRKSFEIYAKQYGKDHIKIAHTLRSIGKNYFLQGLLETAEYHLQQAFDIFRQNNHPETFQCLESLSNLYLKKSSLEATKGNTKQSEIFKKQAINFLKQALQSVQVHYPKNSPHKTRVQERLNSLELDS